MTPDEEFMANMSLEEALEQHRLCMDPYFKDLNEAAHAKLEAAIRELAAAREEIAQLTRLLNMAEKTIVSIVRGFA